MIIFFRLEINLFELFSVDRFQRLIWGELCVLVQGEHTSKLLIANQLSCKDYDPCSNLLIYIQTSCICYHLLRDDTMMNHGCVPVLQFVYVKFFVIFNPTTKFTITCIIKINSIRYLMVLHQTLISNIFCIGMVMQALLMRDIGIDTR